jgi:hypothetical protein
VKILIKIDRYSWFIEADIYDETLIDKYFLMTIDILVFRINDVEYLYLE